MPRAQVRQFQLIAPINAPKITRSSMISGVIMPVPTVWATFRRGWKKLKASADPQQAIVAILVQDVASIQRQLLALNDWSMQVTQDIGGEFAPTIAV